MLEGRTVVATGLPAAEGNLVCYVGRELAPCTLSSGSAVYSEGGRNSFICRRPFFGPFLGLLGFSFTISYASGLPGAFAMGYCIKC